MILVTKINTVFFFTLNKTRTSEVGAIPKAQKAQNIFLEKTFEKSRTVPKKSKGDSLVPSGFVGYV